MKKATKKSRRTDRFEYSQSTGRGPEGLRRALDVMRASKRGRPSKDAATQKTRAKSVRLPEAVWVEIARRAKREGVSDNAVVRDAIARMLEQA